jgi:hypothetical protein
LFEDFFEIIQLEYDKLLTQKEYLQEHQHRLMVVQEPPSPPRYTNNSLHVTPTRHASTSMHTSTESSSDVRPKGLRAILESYRTSSDDSDSDASPKYSPTAQSDSSDSESDSNSDTESEKSNNNDDTDSDVEILS